MVALAVVMAALAVTAAALARVAVARITGDVRVHLATVTGDARVAEIEAGTVQLLAAAPAPPDPKPVTAETVLAARERSTVIVTTKAGNGFRGVLADFDDRALVLRNASAMERGSSAAVQVDGEVLVLWADVDFVQRP